MNEIEKKRKELEQELKDFNYEGTDVDDRESLGFRRGEIHGFNLGVEMARKEFLKDERLFLEQLRYWLRNYAFYENSDNDKEIGFLFNKRIERFKQSLEFKK